MRIDTDDLDKLPEPVKRDLLRRLGFLVTKGPKDDAGSILHDCLSHVLERRGIQVQPISVLKKQRLFTKFQEAEERILALSDHFKPENRVERLYIVRFLLGLLIARLDDQGIRISVKIVLDRLGGIQEEVERCFPGYHASGLLPIVLKRSRYRSEWKSPTSPN